MKFINNISLILVLLMPFIFTGCELVGDIFEAGIWVGIIGVVLLVMLVMWVIRKIR